MGIVTTEREQVCAVAPARLFKAMVFDFTNVLPKALPNFVKSAQVEGDGSPGSFKKVITIDGYVKQRVDVVDVDNYAYHYSIVEGGVLSEEPTLEKVSYEYRLVSNPNGGTIIKGIAKFYTKGDAQLTQEFLKANNEKTSGIAKGVIDYIETNPDLYN